MGTLLHKTGHGLVAHDTIMLANLVGGEGLTENTLYYVLAAGLTADDFAVSLTDGGAAEVYTTDITTGSVVRSDVYAVVNDGNMTPPGTPAAPTGLGIASTAVVDADGHVISTATVTLTPSAVATTRATRIALTVAGTTTNYFLAPAATSFRTTVPAGVALSVSAYTQDVYGQESAAVGPQTTTSAGDTTAPAKVTGIAIWGAIRGLFIAWDASASHDLAHYELHVDTDSGFSAPEVIYCKTSSFSDTQLAVDTYYARVRAIDLSGNLGAWSDTVSDDVRLVIGGTDVQANSLTANDILAGSITADRLAATLILASIIKTAETGARIEEDSAGLRAYDSNGVLILKVPTNGDDIYVHARIDTSSINLSNLMTVDTYDADGGIEVKPGAAIFLDAGTGITPSTAPVLTTDWQYSSAIGSVFAAPSFPSYAIGGGYYDAAGGASGATACYVAVVLDTSSFPGATHVIEWKISDGTIDRDTVLDVDLSTAGAVNAPYITRVGTLWHICYGNTAGTKTYLTRFTRSTGVHSGAAGDISARFFTQTTTGYPIATDGTNLWMAGPSSANNIRIVKYNTSGTYQSTQELTEPGITAPANSRDYYITRFTIKPSGTTCWIVIAEYKGATYYKARAYEYTMSTGAVVANTDFGAANITNTASQALVWDGTNFYDYEQGGAGVPVWTKYSNWSGAITNPYWVAYAWYDSAGTTHESAVSPRASITMDRGKVLRATVPALPGVGGVDDPNNVRLYMKPNATDPGAGNFKLQSTANSRSFTLTDYASGGAADGAGTVFPSLPAGVVTSFNNEWMLRGDGLVSMVGTSFPTGKVANDHFYRSDLKMGFYYDGSQWLSEELFVLGGQFQFGVTPYTATSADAIRWSLPPAAGCSDIYIVDLRTAFNVVTGGTALGASHKWVATLAAWDTAGHTLAGSLSIASGASVAWRTLTASMNVLASTGVATPMTNGTMFTLTWTKTGTPGNLHAYSTVTYRLVAT